MRTKEKAHDYRYFPDPDIQPVRTDDGLYEEAARMPRAAVKKVRLVDKYGVSAYQAGVLAADASARELFRRTSRASQPTAARSRTFCSTTFSPSPRAAAPVPHVPARVLRGTGRARKLGQINGKQAEVFAKMMEEHKSPVLLVKELGLSQVSDVGALEAFCDQAIAANPKSVADFKAGKQNAVNALKGQVMKLSKSLANPQLVGEILVKLSAPDFASACA